MHDTITGQKYHRKMAGTGVWTTALFLHFQHRMKEWLHLFCILSKSPGIALKTITGIRYGDTATVMLRDPDLCFRREWRGVLFDCFLSDQISQ